MANFGQPNNFIECAFVHRMVRTDFSRCHSSLICKDLLHCKIYSLAWGLGIADFYTLRNWVSRRKRYVSHGLFFPLTTSNETQNEVKQHLTTVIFVLLRILISGSIDGRVFLWLLIQVTNSHSDDLLLHMLGLTKCSAYYNMPSRSTKTFLLCTVMSFTGKFSKQSMQSFYNPEGAKWKLRLCHANSRRSEDEERLSTCRAFPWI